MVFYYDIQAILSRFLRFYSWLKFMQYDDFYEIKEIGSGGYGTVYTAKYKLKEKLRFSPEQVVLKKFKDIDGKTELFISEVSIHM